MVNRVDGVILGVGIVVLVASVVGVILYDEQSPQEYVLTWGQSEAIELDEQTDSGGPGEFAFETNVSQANLARAEWTVEVTASGTNVQDDSIDVEVVTADGETGSCSFGIPGGSTEASGDCTVEFDLNPQPEIPSANGVNNTDAEEQALEDAELTNGTGLWETTVTVDGGTEISEPSYEVALTPALFTWEPTASQQGPGGRAG